MNKSIEVTIPNLSVRLSEQRKAEGVKWYIPWEPDQLPFHQSTARERWAFGGNRSGKTEAGAAEVVMWIKGSQRFRPRKIVRSGTAWIVSVTTEKQREVTQPKVLKWLPKGDIEKIQNIQRGIIDYILLKSGWRILFKNYSQDVDTFGGQDVDIIWFDEEPPQEIYKECLMRTIDRGGIILGTMTPQKGMTWVYNKIYENVDHRESVDHFFFDTGKNPHLSTKDKEEAWAVLSEQEKLVRKEGKFVVLTGLIYEKFDRKKHTIDVFDIPLGWPRIVAIDPHLKKATSVVWIAVANENMKGVKRGDYIIYRQARRKGETPDIASMIQIANGPYEKIKCYVIDPSKPNVKEEWPGQTILDVFAAHGIPAQKANKAVEQGIMAVKTRLAASPPTLWVFKDCTGVMWEFEHYMYSDPADEDGKPYSERIFKKSDDYVDCVRYGINTGIGPSAHAGSIGEPVYSETGRFMGTR